jgi:hypothetical protein
LLVDIRSSTCVGFLIDSVDAEFNFASNTIDSKVNRGSGKNISQVHWLEGVRKTVFRPNSPLFAK